MIANGAVTLSKHPKGRLGPRVSDVTFLDQWRSVFQGSFMVSHGFWLVSMVFQVSFMVSHGFWLVSMVFHGFSRFMVGFHSFVGSLGLAGRRPALA